jgi:hypothetical protein
MFPVPVPVSPCFSSCIVLWFGMENFSGWKPCPGLVMDGYCRYFHGLEFGTRNCISHQPLATVLFLTLSNCVVANMITVVLDKSTHHSISFLNTDLSSGARPSSLWSAKVASKLCSQLPILHEPLPIYKNDIYACAWRSVCVCTSTAAAIRACSSCCMCVPVYMPYLCMNELLVCMCVWF